MLCYGRLPYFFVKENSNVCHKHFAVFTLLVDMFFWSPHVLTLPANFRACFTEGGKDESRRKKLGNKLEN